MEGALPSFLGLGAQKGGTTTLHLLLAQHPGVFLPADKELHYFSLYYGKGEAWYRHHFLDAHPGQRCGEITPYYLYHPWAPARIHKLMPKARLIVLLRDPVERTLSQYFHSRRLGLEPLSLTHALAAEKRRLEGAEEILANVEGHHRSHQEHSYLSRSCYQHQLQRLETLFAEEQVLVIRSEDLFAHPEVIWQKLLNFLQLDQWPMPSLGKPANAGEGEAAEVPFELRNWLRGQLDSTYSWVAKRHGIVWG